MAGEALSRRPNPIGSHIETDLSTIPELRQICDFEGVVGWVLGLDRMRPYRVMGLRNPGRVVVDVRR